jgi:ABC-type bacteriocin/lantibiotic exporter with double-glycine peptidase domain
VSAALSQQPVTPELSPGARAAHALHRYLHLHGARPRLSELVEQCPAAIDAGWLEQRCGEHGAPVRVVELSGRRLRSLRVPALVALSDGSAQLLTRAGLRRVTLEDGWGRRTRWPIPELLARCGSTALEPAPLLRGVTGLVRAWVAVLLRERRLVLEALVTSIALACAGLFAPWLSGSAVDHALPSGAIGYLQLLAIGTVAAALLRGGLGYLRQRALIGLDGRIQVSALREAFARLLTRPYLEVSGSSVGEQTQIVDSVERVAQAPAEFTFAPLMDLLLIAGYLFGLGWIAWPIGASVGALAALGIVAGGALAVQAARVEREASEAGARATGLLHELVSGVQSIKAAGAARACVGRWFGLVVDERALVLRRDTLELWSSSVALAVQQLSALLVIGAGGYAVLGGTLSLGRFATALLYADALSASAARLTEALAKLALLAPHVQRAQALMRRPMPPRVQPLMAASSGDADAIVLEDVWFRYRPDAPWVLQGYSLRVRRGEHLRLRGRSGHGKTTVLRLIAGLLEPERGSVRVFGSAPRQADACFAYLPQDCHLLEGSIRNNLMLMSGVAPNELGSALAATGLDQWIETLPMRLETMLPPGGHNLSGGQRQWIALTAALASRRPILLLDESTSHIDRPRREQLKLEQLFAGRTVVMVSHES